MSFPFVQFCRTDAASLPTSVLDALPERKARLEQMTMLCLQRVNITLVRRWFLRNPGLSERTTEMMIWSSSFPDNTKVRFHRQRLFLGRTLERVDVEDFVLPWEILSLEIVLDERPLGIIRGNDAEGLSSRLI